MAREDANIAKLKAVLKAQFNLKRSFDLIDFNREVLDPQVEKAQILLSKGEALEITIGDQADVVV